MGFSLFKKFQAPRHGGARHEGIGTLNPLMARRRALQAAFQPMSFTDPFREVALHGRELFAAADDRAGVQLAAFVEGVIMPVGSKLHINQ